MKAQTTFEDDAEQLACAVAAIIKARKAGTITEGQWSRLADALHDLDCWFDEAAFTPESAGWTSGGRP